MVAPAEAMEKVGIERDARRVLLPAATHILLGQALEAASDIPEDYVDGDQFPSFSTIEELNFCPAITSTYAIFFAAKNVLNDSAILDEILTPEQTKILYETVDVAAISPDHHFKNNF